MKGISASDDVDGHKTTSTVTSAGNLAQLKPNPNEMSVKTTTSSNLDTATASTINIIPTTKLELHSSTPLP